MPGEWPLAALAGWLLRRWRVRYGRHSSARRRRRARRQGPGQHRAEDEADSPNRPRATGPRRPTQGLPGAAPVTGRHGGRPAAPPDGYSVDAGGPKARLGDSRALFSVPTQTRVNGDRRKLWVHGCRPSRSRSRRSR